MGVLLSLETTKPKDEIINLGKQLAMQVAASSPLSIDKSDLDENILKKEKEIIREEMKSLTEAKKLTKKEYIELAKDFVGQHKDSIIRYVKQHGYVDLQQMTVDTADALRYDPEYKNIDADWLYDAIEKVLRKHSWWKRLGIRL